ncbi:MAG: carbohydrate deacetylase [Thermoanaerobaculia bacterium]
MRVLIVTADDVGLHAGLVRGAIHAHKNGIVTACSVVANGNEFPHAVELLRDTPSLEVGLHLALVEEKPVSPPQKVRSLVTNRGRFYPTYRQFSMRYYAGVIRMDEVVRELRAQIEIVLARGLPVVHANGHEHVHVLPRIWEIVQNLAEEYRIRYLRLPVDVIPASAGIQRASSIGALNYFGRKAKAASRGVAVVCDHTLGIAEAGHLTEERIIRLLDAVEGLTELVVHPATDTDDLRKHYPWGYAWEGETAALCSPLLREEIASRGIVLTSPSGAVASRAAVTV